MQMMSEEDARETPLVELLESVPKNARMIYEHSEFCSENIPVGDLCHKAAKALRDRLAQPERQWVGLTDEDVREAFNTAYDGEDFGLIGDFSWFAELIEAKLKEKNA
jgi:hypothetical protein